MKLLLALLLTPPIFAEIPCLDGQGPLQETQWRCGDLFGSMPRLDFNESVGTAARWMSSSLMDTPTLTIQLPQSEGRYFQQDWSKMFTAETRWMFKANGESLEINGEDLLRLVKEHNK